jgi:hypothetical protein
MSFLLKMIDKLSTMFVNAQERGRSHDGPCGQPPHCFLSILHPSFHVQSFKDECRGMGINEPVFSKLYYSIETQGASVSSRPVLRTWPHNFRTLPL